MIISIVLGVIFIFLLVLFILQQKPPIQSSHSINTNIQQLQQQLQSTLIPTTINTIQSLPTLPISTSNKILVGIVYSESLDDDSVYELYQTNSIYWRNKYIYTIKDTFTGAEIQLNNGNEINELYTNDKISIPPIRGQYIVLINKPIPITREPTNKSFKNVGILYSESKSNTDNSIFPLYEQEYYLQKDRYMYKIKDNIHNIEIPLFFQESVKKLEDGDKIIIPTKESMGKYIVQFNKSTVN